MCLPARAQAADTAGVLILGDSNSEGPFGGMLYDGLRHMRDPVTKNRLKVSIFAKCGAGAHDWVDKSFAKFICGAWNCSNDRILFDCEHLRDGAIPPLHELYADLGADRRVTLVALGVNMLWGDRDQNLRDAATLIAAIHAEGSACIWIGPPQTGDAFVTVFAFNSFVTALRKTVTKNGCRFIASDDKTDRRRIAPREDHYSDADSVDWAQKVLDELDQPASPGDRPFLTLFARGAAME